MGVNYLAMEQPGRQHGSVRAAGSRDAAGQLTGRRAHCGSSIIYGRSPVVHMIETSSCLDK